MGHLITEQFMVLKDPGVIKMSDKITVLAYFVFILISVIEIGTASE